MRRQLSLNTSVCAASLWTICALGLLSVTTGVIAGETRVAVASNFTVAANAIGALFERETGHLPIFSFGATGQLYTQVTQGAPYDVFLAADKTRPARAVEEGYAVAGTRFTYANGRLALFSRKASRVNGKSTLTGAENVRIAIANPVIAPYGAAAISVLRSLGVYEKLQSRLVRGTNIAQAYQFAFTGNAALGFVALSQVVGRKDGSHWVVPAYLHPTIAQDAVLLRHGAHNAAAHAFIAFLKEEKVRREIGKFGYGSEE